jgi:hypothetical protein
MMASPLIVAIDSRPADPVSNRVRLAASTNAAVNWRDYGTSRWQLAVEMLHQLRVQAEGGTPTFGGGADIAVRS